HPQLKVVVIPHNLNVKDGWACSLKHLKQLEMLIISHSPFGDRGLTCLAQMPPQWRKHLRVLNLNDTDITSNGLASLLAFPNLAELQLTDNDISHDHPVLAELRRHGVFCYTGNARLAKFANSMADA